MPPYGDIIFDIAILVLADLVCVSWMPMSDLLEAAGCDGLERIRLDIAVRVIRDILPGMAQMFNVSLWRDAEGWAPGFGGFGDWELETDEVRLGRISKQLAHSFRPGRPHVRSHCTEELQKTSEPHESPPASCVHKIDWKMTDSIRTKE